MGAITQIYSPTEYSEHYYSSSRIQFTYRGNNYTSGSNFVLSNPQIDYSFTNGSYSLVGYTIYLSATVQVKAGSNVIGDYVFTYPKTTFSSSTTLATTGTLTLSGSPSNKTVNMSNVFNSNNASSSTSTMSIVLKSLTAYVFDTRFPAKYMDSWISGDRKWQTYNGAASWMGYHDNTDDIEALRRHANGYKITSPITYSGLGVITLNAPPTFGVNLSYSPSGSYKYANYTTAIATLVNISPKYGATFTSASLQIGTQVSTVNSSTNNPSILLNATGTFAPKITLTDSRNQSSTITLSNITVTSPVKPSITQLTGVRLDANNKVDDSGVKLLIIMKASKDTNVASFSAPTTSCKRTDTNNAIEYGITWYSTATVSSNTYTFSNQISNWASISNEATVYGLITAATDIIKGDYGYTVAVTPKTSTTNSSTLTGTTATVVFPPAYYTLDFKAGGKGIAFGGPSITNEFDCHMNAYFEGTKYFYINENAPDNYYDKLIYNLFKSFGWITDSDTSGLTD